MLLGNVHSPRRHQCAVNMHAPLPVLRPTVIPPRDKDSGYRTDEGRRRYSYGFAGDHLPFPFQNLVVIAHAVPVPAPGASRYLRQPRTTWVFSPCSQHVRIASDRVMA